MINKKENKSKYIKRNDISLGKAKSIIYSPMITEKSTTLSQYNQVAFKVDVNSSSIEIKNAIEKLFKVKVKKVNTINNLGKIKSFKNKYGRRSDSKKAIVTLDQGNTVDISAGVKWQ